MKLLHSPSSLPDGISPEELDFDTIQVACDFFHPDPAIATIIHGHPDLNIWLTLHGAWWLGGENPFAALTNWLEGAKAVLGERLLGVRLNHEYSPTQFPEGYTDFFPKSNFQQFLSSTGHMDMVYYWSSHLGEWRTLLQQIKSGLNAVHMLEGTTHPAQLKTLYRLFVDFQCRLTSTMIRTFADTCNVFGLKLLVYPGNLSVPGAAMSPRLFPKIEDTLDRDQTGIHPAIIWELSSWDSFSQAWVEAHCKDVPGHWIMTMQQNLQEVYSQERAKESMKWRLTSFTNPPIGVGFWSNWTSSRSSSAAQLDYLRGIQAALLM